MKKDMNTVRQIRTLLIMLALLMGATNGAWALSETDIKIDESITHGSVTIKSVDDATRTVTITVEPASGYFVNKSDIIVQKLLDPSNASTRSNTPDIAETLEVSGPSSSSVEADYTFVVPADYAGALVTVTFTGMNPATATITPNSLTYTGEEQELVTLENVVGGAATDPVTYSLVGVSGPYSSAIPTATNAGTYTVYYKVAGDASHAEGSGSVSVTIDKAQITNVELANNAINYNGIEHSVSITSVTAGTIDVPTSDYTYSGNTATDVGTYTVTVTAKPESTNFTGSATASFRIVEQTITIINSSTSADDVTALNGHYLIMGNINASVLANLYSTTVDFTGTLEAGSDDDGNLYQINMSGYNHALFNTVNGGTVKNIILDNVTITSGVNVGAICNEATGASRIYNCGVLATGSTVTTDDDGFTEITSCSSTIGGSGYVGGIVGLLDGSSRVINCFSYANITGGNEVGGIVGHNNVATTSDNLQTMVMNCMFYGDITGGTSKAPIYNGEIITNVSTGTGANNKGVSNFNYFWGDASYVQNRHIDKYNCALMAETRFLQRFEFFRHLLNSHRELAAWWASTTSNTVNSTEIAKWVLEPSQIGTSMPYPILKAPKDGNGNYIQYPSVVNIDAKNATTQTERNKGGKLGTLTVNIEMGDGNSLFTPAKPADAEIITSKLTLNITDKDPDHFNFNYYKVQLPYYNDVGTNNYTDNRVVTGWKIVNITVNGTTTTTGTGGWSTSDDATATVNEEGEITLTTPYNFADRTSTKKDLYDVSGRVFNQGAYWDVPEGVTAITIEPYWAKAVYLADSYADVVYDTNMKTAYNVPNVGGGQKYTNGGENQFKGQKVYTALTGDGGAIASDVLGPYSSNSVYDYAVVLVGNFHYYGSIEANKPYTVTTVDLNGDNEPDYSFILRFNGRNALHPVRYDFLNLVGLGMAQKSTGGTGTYNFGIFVPKGWFESTNTSLFQFTQFEYEHSSRTVNDPLILQGGVMEQWVSFNQNGISQRIPYYHVGGNVWFKEFHRGTHQDRQQNTKHPPISVTGGDFKEFYLTGLYRADFANYEDNLECYINGGRFGIVAGAAQEGAGKASDHTKGNVVWQIQNTDIDEFYGGGLNAVHPVEGNITTVITGGYIKQFCGGPKFGDMNTGKTVMTTATNCKFDTFFGAGYGGNSYSRFTPSNINNIDGDYGESSWNTWLNTHYKQEYSGTYKGVSTTFTTQYIPMSNNYQNVARLLIDYVSFSLATTHSVTSNLTGCTITRNFYGGGSLGKVAGPVTSTLDNCIVNGNVFGAGFSATLPTVDVMNTGGFIKAPYFDSNLGVYMDPIFPATVEYNWQQRTDGKTVNTTALAIDKTNHILYTNINLDKSNLGSVAGNVILTIKGNSVIGTPGDTTKGNVFGGGESSYVTGADHTVTVNIQGNTEVNGNVFGGGDNGEVQGSATVNIKE